MREATSKSTFLRHVVATIAYRGGKAIRNAPSGFAGTRVSPGSRTPLEILAHISDVLAWALSIVDGKQSWSGTRPESWALETDRFYMILGRLDSALEIDTGEDLPASQLFQGPFADSLTHIGQLAMLRRVAGSPVKGENYFQARIAPGSVGREQVVPENEFD